MQPDQQSGDYGYDLVHEEVARSAVPAPRSAPPPPSAPPASRPGVLAADHATDLGGDFGYDEAHGS